MAKPTAKQRLALFETMLLIRRFEELNVHIWPKHKYMGQQHLYIGHEATASGVGHAMGKNDLIFSTHRNHGYVLARGVDPGRALAEVLGREGGTNKGRGGPWHIADASKGALQTSAMLGGGAGIGVGAAYGLKKKRGKGVAVVHMGDGTFPEGIAYESFNMAAVFGLPVLFLCENNAIEGGRGGMVSLNKWMDLPRALNIHCEGPVDGGDPDAVFAATSKILDRIRKKGGPGFLQTNIEAWPGSHMSPPGFPTGVTDLTLAMNPKKISGKHADWIRQDPVLRYAKALIRSKASTLDKLQKIDAAVDKRLKGALDYAESSPFPDPSTALDYVFA
jgi:TPP-dependent pyruvate/acetoin dehydrogenase alpha subunit